jgi:hypothetical protein
LRTQSNEEFRNFVRARETTLLCKTSRVNGKNFEQQKVRSWMLVINAIYTLQF